MDGFKDFKLNDFSWKSLKIIFEKPHLINVFQMSSDSSEDIELAILKAFLACMNRSNDIKHFNLNICFYSS